MGVKFTHVPPVTGTRNTSELPVPDSSPAKTKWVMVGDQKTWLGNQPDMSGTTRLKPFPLGLIVQMPPEVNAITEPFGDH